MNAELLARWSLTLLVASVSGCSSAAPEEVDTTDEQLTVTPTGDERLGRLLLLLPPGFCRPQDSCASPLEKLPDMYLDGLPIHLGRTRRVVPGAHVLKVNEATWPLSLQAGENREVRLPVVRRTCMDAPPYQTPAHDFGSTPPTYRGNCPSSVGGPTTTLRTVNVKLMVGPLGDTEYYGRQLTLNDDCSRADFQQPLVNYVTGGRRSYSLSTTQPVSVICRIYQLGNFDLLGDLIKDQTSVGSQYAVFAPGDYSYFQASWLPRVSFALAEGEVRDLSVSQKIPAPPGSQPRRPFETFVTFADARNLLPTATIPSIESSCKEEPAYNFRENLSGTVHLTAYQSDRCKYALFTSGRSVKLDQDRPNNITLRRLDIDDVVVTREDGSSYTVRGLFELYFEGRSVGGPARTHVGLDVFPGTYELVVRYKTALGDQVSRTSVTL